MAEKSAKEPRDFEKKDLSELEKRVNSIIQDKLENAYKEADKQKRTELIAEVKSEVDYHASLDCCNCDEID